MENLNEGHYHEALDRCYTVTEIIQIMLLNHPVFGSEKHKAWAAKVQKAQEAIAEVYQEIGSYEWPTQQ